MVGGKLEGYFTFIDPFCGKRFPQSRGWNPKPRRCTLIIAVKSRMRFDGAIDSLLNRQAESKLGLTGGAEANLGKYQQAIWQ